MSTFNQNSGTAVPTLINSSAVLVTGNAVSSNALTVRQFGTGNVFSAQTTTGSTALFVGANGNVGVGTTGPVYQLSVATGLGATATPTVQILDTVGPKSLSVVTNASSGVYNAMVATGDTLMVAGVGSTVNTGVLTLAPWSAGSVGARIGGSSNIFGIYSNATTFYSNAVSPATVMTVVNGNVGIGTTNPSAGAVVNNSFAGALLDVYASGTGVSSNVNISAGCDGSASSSNKASLIFNIKGSGGGIVNGGITHQLLGSNYGFNFQPLTLGTSVMVIKGDGNVGIGTASPGNLLVVQGSGAAGRSEFGGDFIELGAGRTSDGSSYIDFHSAEATYPDYALRIIRFGGANTTTQILHRGTGEISYVTVDAADHAWYTSNAEKMRLTSAGRLGIGLSNPFYPLHVATSTTSSTTLARWFNVNGGLNSTTQTFITSIYSAASVMTSDVFVAISDERAKVLEQPPIEPYLNLIDKIQVHQYSWIDKIEKGSTKKIGFFAQEVEEVVPDAVGHTTAIVPTIYRQANAFTESTITVTNHGIITEKKLEIVDLENGKTKIDIVRVIDADNLEVKFEKVPKDKLFVVGPEVDDSRVLNHDYLMAVGFGGLKELHALVKTQQTTIEMLTERLALLESKLAA
jgi:hypothetical protein